MIVAILDSAVLSMFTKDVSRLRSLFILPLYIAAQNLIEFWYVCTRPLNRNGLGLSTSETEKELAQMEALLLLLPEVPAIFPEWRRIVTAHAVSGVDVFDARLVAVMRVYGIKDLLTFNTADFTRYSALNVVDPSSVR